MSSRLFFMFRSVTTEVSEPTGDSVFVDNTPRLLVVAERPSVSGANSFSLLNLTVH